MKNLLLSILLSLIVWVTITNAATWPSLVMNKNQVAVNQKNITTRGNISSVGAEENCLKYLQKFGKNAWKKSCISYTILVPNYKNKFGLFIREELWAQELIGKTVYLYNFQKKALVDVKYLFPKNFREAVNFTIWFSSWKLTYTTWNGDKYSEPQSIEMDIFTK